MAEKCLILTPCINITEKDIERINNSDIFKIAVNDANYPSDVRLFQDFIHAVHFINNYKEPLITCSYALNSLVTKEVIEHLDRFILFYKTVKQPNTPSLKELYFETGSLIPSIDYAIKRKYSEILIVGNNTVHGGYFTQQIDNHIKRFHNLANIYQFQKGGNFQLPHKSITDFIEH